MLRTVRFLRMHLTKKPQIIGRSVTGKLPEIPNKMRLVMKKELVCNPRPIDGLGEVNTRQNVAKPIEAAQLFWCTTDHLLELYDEVLLAHPHPLAELANRQYAVMAGELCHGTLHDLEFLRGFTQAGQEKLFQQGKPRLDRGRSIQPFTELGSERSPDRIQRHNLIS